MKVAFESLDAILTQEKEQLPAKATKSAIQELEVAYQRNKNDIEKEYARVKDIISNLHHGITILESDYRNIFYRFDDIVTFQS